jgi:hypothetical protein
MIPGHWLFAIKMHPPDSIRAEVRFRDSISLQSNVLALRFRNCGFDSLLTSQLSNACLFCRLYRLSLLPRARANSAITVTATQHKEGENYTRGNKFFHDVTHAERPDLIGAAAHQAATSSRLFSFLPKRKRALHAEQSYMYPTKVGPVLSKRSPPQWVHTTGRPATSYRCGLIARLAALMARLSGDVVVINRDALCRQR